MGLGFRKKFIKGWGDEEKGDMEIDEIRRL